MLKSLLVAVLALGFAGPDEYAKVLGETKFTLAESIDKGMKEAGSGVLFKAWLRSEGEMPVFCLEFSQATKVLGINVEGRDGKVLGKHNGKEDKSALVGAFKISAKQAIEAALKKAEGKAVGICLKLNSEKKPETLVVVHNAGKLHDVLVNGVDGSVISVKERRKFGFLGVDGAAAQSAGVKINKIVKETAAEKAGLAAGDVLISINGKKVNNLKQLSAAISEAGAGQKAAIEFQRDGKTSLLSITLGERYAEDEDDEDGEDDDEDEDDGEEGGEEEGMDD